MASPLRILHLEDDPNDAELVQETLAGGDIHCRISRVDTGEAFKAALEQERFDLILSDYHLPTVTGLDALKLAVALRPTIPFIFVSGVMGEEFAVLTLQLGATDYVLKKNLSRLPAAVRRALQEAEATATRMRMEESLRLHASRMKSILETSLDAIIVMDSKGVISQWNRQAEHTFGWQERDVLGRTVAEVIIPHQHREAHTRGLARFLATGEGPLLNRRVEVTALHRTGREFPVELAITPAETNGHWQFTGFVRDITERKLAEEGIRLFRTLLDNVKDSIEVIDPETGRFVDGNEAAWTGLGYTRDEFLSMTVPEIDPLVTRPVFVELTGRLRETGATLVLESVHRRKDGTTFPVEISAQLIRQDEAREHVVAIVRDITERKRAERRLHAQYEVTRVLAESATLHEAGAKILQVLCECLGWEEGGIWKVDRDANLLRCQETWHVPTVDIAEFVTDSRQRTFASGIGMPGRVWSSGEPAWIPDVLKDLNSPRAAVATKAGLHAAIGFPIKIGRNLYGVIEFFSRKVREPDTELMQLVGDIGIKIGQFIERKEADASLQERELARLSAERANQAKSEFLSRMSHELRTPLNAVLGFAQLLEMDPLSPEQREHVQHILKGGRHLLALINEVLDIARIEAGRMTFSLEPVAVASVLGEAVDLIRPQAAARKIQLASPVAQEQPVYVRADRQRLKQVLLNLLSNGVKYNREGGTLTVSAKTIPEGRCRMTVVDTGGGIPAAMMTRLFTPFDRLEADSSTEGTGLGLVLSRGLITAMGGTLYVDSVVGQGTSVCVELPLSKAPEGRAQALPEKVEVSAPLSNQTLMVLYIEDNQSNYQLVERLVEKRPGVKLIGAMQGKLGVELAVAHRPDLIFLDLNLPDIQGDEVLLRLRECPETAGIPVVMLSADAMPRQINKLLAAGAQRYLTKPIEVAQFYALLDEFAAKKGG